MLKDLSLSKLYSIYLLIDPISLLPRYIGISGNVKLRFRNHLNENKKTHKSHWIKQLLKIGKEPILSVICNNLTIQQAKEQEIKLIREYREMGYPLTNITNGGEGCFGRIVSKEERDAISKRTKGIKRAQETGIKISISKKGKPSPRKGVHLILETKQKLREANLGKTMLESTKIKISVKLKGHVPWNKGLKGCNGMKDKYHTQDSKIKMSETKKRKNEIKKLIAAGKGDNKICCQ